MAERDGDILVTTPDLITVLDAESGLPVTADALRYGLRLKALAMPSQPAMADARRHRARRSALLRLRHRLPRVFRPLSRTPTPVSAAQAADTCAMKSFTSRVCSSAGAP